VANFFSAASMKFVADVMLGRLVRLMRFDGYDVEYDNRATDETLLQRSRYRILLTKDRELAKLAPKKHVYEVISTDGENQLAEIRKKFKLSGQTPRCLVCNNEITRIARKHIQHLVPPFVYQKHQDFYICRRCKRIYWPGTHHARLSRA
jgi:uncharacterized protein with PIN domain